MSDQMWSRARPEDFFLGLYAPDFLLGLMLSLYVSWACSQRSERCLQEVRHISWSWWGSKSDH